MSDITEKQLEKLEAPFAPYELFYRIVASKKEMTDSGYIQVHLAAAYVQSRAIFRRLDHVVGKSNWKIEHDSVRLKIDESDGYNKQEQKKEYRSKDADGVISTLYIRVNGEWISKSDGAGITGQEPLKGGISNATKRVGVPWGIGLYLYDLGELRVDWAEDQNMFKNTGNFYDPFKKERVYFSWKDPALPPTAFPNPKSKPFTYEIQEIERVYPFLKGRFRNRMDNYLDGNKISEITRGTAIKIIRWIRKINWSDNYSAKDNSNVKTNNKPDKKAKSNNNNKTSSGQQQPQEPKRPKQESKPSKQQGKQKNNDESGIDFMEEDDFDVDDFDVEELL